MRQRLSRGVKFREAIRPFAASVLEERVPDLFREPARAPYMEILFTIRDEWRAKLPAVVHADGSVRAQTVSAKHEPLFHRLIAAFERRTGCPAVLNTSFNEDTPIVRSPSDAIACFENTKLDALVIGNRLLLG
jgi:carbamoyltransferase